MDEIPNECPGLTAPDAISKWGVVPPNVLRGKPARMLVLLSADWGLILIEVEDREASERRELAYLCNWYVVIALAVALVFSAPDVFGGNSLILL